MTNDTKANMIATAVVVVAGALIVAVPLLILQYKCQVRWERSGMASEFRLFGGCQVQHEGRWIPETNYREIP